MTAQHRVISDTYHDSGQLMRIASDAVDTTAADDAEAVMGTETNLATLRESGWLDAGALDGVGPDDLVMAATASDPADASAALDQMVADLEAGGDDGPSDGGRPAPRSIRQARANAPHADLALVSVPGDYAVYEAWTALHEGLHVHLFSDGVSRADERALKEFASAEDRLLMGPDCGTAIIDGRPLGFANEVPEGRVGVVSASGTGLQAVTSRLARRGAGVSQAVGTGGRDLSAAVEGLMTRTALRRLDADDATSVIVVLSKPPSAAALDAVTETVAECDTPVVAHFQGIETDSDVMATAGTLAATADKALSILDANVDSSAGETADDGGVSVGDSAGELLRGLFVGGTLCTEAALIARDSLGTVSSNVGVGDSLSDPLSPAGHAFVDFGTDELTDGHPHPMIDPSLRTERLAAALGDDRTGAVLLDVVLGHGSHPDPAAAVADVVADADAETPVVASVCGTDADPQTRSAQVQTLQDAGVRVAESNAAAARIAARGVARLGGDFAEGGSA